MNSNASEQSLQDLRLELDTPFIKNFDPVRFAFISSLSQRADSQHHKLNAMLDEKARGNIQRYLADLNDHRDHSMVTIDQLNTHFPEQLDAAKILFEQCEFTKIEQLFDQLRRKQLREPQGSVESLAALRDLTNNVNQQAVPSHSFEQTYSFDEILGQQEQRERLAADYSPASDNKDSDARIQLLSMKKHLESIKSFNIDKTIDNAINEAPKNPGPHNPQMLAIKSLSKIRGLSPEYARRFAGYIETLLWLEMSSAKLNK